jgi:hypothetical protein
MVSDRDVSPSSVIAWLPCELLEQVAFWISVGKDVVVNWLNACDGSGADLGDLQLIAKFPAILGHDKVALRWALLVDATLKRDARLVIGRVLRF